MKLRAALVIMLTLLFIGVLTLVRVIALMFVVSVEAQIWYSETNSTTASWTSTLSNVANGSEWYSRLNITSSGYSGDVIITWFLQKQDGSWSNVAGATQTITVTLTGNSGQTIYASSDGSIAGNKNWGAYTTDTGTYRVKVTIETS